MQTYRQGAVGALMDEYERVSGELARLIGGLSDDAFQRIRDRDTLDEACRSIQTIMTHVVGAGYTYAGMMRDAWGVERRGRGDAVNTASDALAGLDAMLEYMTDTLDGHWDLSEADSNAMRMTSRWGPVYDFEQLFEHAIVHVMRHRRQIERFLARERDDNASAS
jgi:hypothetical protein